MSCNCVYATKVLVDEKVQFTEDGAIKTLKYQCSKCRRYSSKERTIKFVDPPPPEGKE
jgi:hypothetical protein